MLYYLYDNTFEGLLTAVFDLYFRKESPQRICGEATAVPLFTETHTVVTDIEKASRVLQGLKKKISRPAINMLYVCYLSEIENIELTILRYIQKALASEISIETNFADDDVLELSKIYKKVSREAERMRMFVRFQKTADGVFFAVMEPAYNVLPLCVDFFQDRYADQQWLIYDIRRQFGLFYDLQTVETVNFETPPDWLRHGKINREQQDESETAFQDLWKEYLSAITIRERKNLKLQRQFMPKRFWKYLTEK
ncbi:MAG: TIGR03915 family putative DNA repair protein [Dysgonamonadaceae bacterium]|jgi:probable DNA metabolism protein|nr:TIGR03915 family putative DNA repair protein [Dysgonamonadaceae bacterium]